MQCIAQPISKKSETSAIHFYGAPLHCIQTFEYTVLKDLPLAVRWRRCSRQGRASSPTVGERALAASQQIGNLGTWEVSRGALECDNVLLLADKIRLPKVFACSFLPEISRYERFSQVH